MGNATESLTFFSLLGALAVLIWFLTSVTSSLVGEKGLTRALVWWTAVLATATVIRSEKGLEGVAAISAGVPNALEIVSTAVQASAKSLQAACSEGQS